MSVNTTHPEYNEHLPKWIRARDVLGGEDAIKVAGEKYLRTLDGQSDDEYESYKARAVFFNATARTVAGYLGMIFRKPPFLRLPGQPEAGNSKSETRNPNDYGAPARGERKPGTALGKAMAEFSNDADMLGTSLYGYCKQVVGEVVGVGRCGTLIDWEGEVENRGYATLYRAEQILNWRVERVAGRNIATMVVLHEPTGGERMSEDFFDTEVGEQIRVLRLEEVRGQESDVRVQGSGVRKQYQCVVDIWRPKKEKKETNEWEVVETRIPLRLGRPLPLIPFVFHGPEHSRPAVARVPLEDMIAENLGHYRMDADYKHGLHFTALPTAWVSGFDKAGPLKIGSSSAWVTETPGAQAGYLEYTGQGLSAFERALDHAERLMAVLGSRLLEGQKKSVETAEAMVIRQSGEDSILSSIATSVSESLTLVMRWVYWWNSTEEVPEDVTDQQALVDLNTDFRTHGMTAQEITALVSAWQAGAISQDTMFELFRRSEILPDGRGNEEEARLVNRAVISDQSSVTKKNGNEAKKEPGMVDGG